ncbi:hypothetical protein OIU76_018424, partial [Salix suchowensis]
MDTLIASALEEVCYHVPAGVSLSSLCSTLALTPSPSIRASPWTNLRYQYLLFNSPFIGNDMPFGLGYSGTKGTRNLEKCKILRCVVEEFEAKVDGKAECCLSFVIPPKNFESKTRGCDSEVL